MKRKNSLILLVLISLSVILLVIACNEPTVKVVKKVVYITPNEDTSVDLSNNSTVAAFWGLPGITFDKWRPNIHIKASSMNGALKNRVWDGTPDVDPDTWSLFEYSQILYYDSNYIGNDIQPDKDATIDNEIIMPLAFEQKIYKRISLTAQEPQKYDVTWDGANKTIVINLNTVNSNYLILKPGARLAVFATQRPTQWGAVNDYTIVDAIPGDNSLQKSVNKQTILDSTSDRKTTRTLGYLTYKGGTDTYEDTSWVGHWFEKIVITQDKITLYIPKLESGNKAKEYWDSIDKTPVEPYMLFWITIQQ